MKDIIKNYVNNLTLENVSDFIHKSNYHIKEEEIEIIYKYIKNRRWLQLPVCTKS